LLDGIKGFDWDLHNVGHVDRHGVDPNEVEEAVGRPHVIVPGRDAGGREALEAFRHIRRRTVSGGSFHDSG